MEPFLLMTAASFAGCLLAILAAWLSAPHIHARRSLPTAADQPRHRTPRPIALTAAAVFAAVATAIVVHVNDGSMNAPLGIAVLVLTLAVLAFVMRQFQPS